MILRWPHPNRLFGGLDALALAGALGFLVARFIPVARLPFWACPIRRATGIPCPGCGLTRVADRFSHFNFTGAWEANPLGTLAAAGFAGVIFLSLGHLIFKLPIPEVTLTHRETLAARWGILALFLLNYGFLVWKATCSFS